MMDCDLLYTKWSLTSVAIFSQRLNGIQYGILSKMFSFVTRKQQKKSRALTLHVSSLLSTKKQMKETAVWE